MEIKQLQAAIEATLFASGDAIEIEKLAQTLEIDKQTVSKLVKQLMDQYDGDGRGICIVLLDDKVQMCSKPQYGEYVRKILDMRRNTPLSQAAMEVLAIVAYNQPVTKAFVEQIRGVDCSGVLGSLTVKGLIEERGRLELPGRPLLYGTTTEFLRCLNIASLDDLPPLPEKLQAGAGEEEESSL